MIRTRVVPGFAGELPDAGASFSSMLTGLPDDTAAYDEFAPQAVSPSQQIAPSVEPDASAYFRASPVLTRRNAIDVVPLALAAGRSTDAVLRALRGEPATPTPTTSALVASAANMLWMQAGQAPGSTPLELTASLPLPPLPPASAVGRAPERIGDPASRGVSLRAEQQGAGVDRTSRKSKASLPDAMSGVRSVRDVLKPAKMAEVTVGYETPSVDDFTALPSTAFTFTYEGYNCAPRQEMVYLIREQAHLIDIVKWKNPFSVMEDRNGKRFIFITVWKDPERFSPHAVMDQLIERLSGGKKLLRQVGRGYIDPVSGQGSGPSVERHFAINDLAGGMMYNSWGSAVALTQEAQLVSMTFLKELGVRIDYPKPKRDDDDAPPRSYGPR
jgi:hypothetical protein